MYIIFLDFSFSYGEYEDVVGYAKTKKEAKKIVEKAVKILNKKNINYCKYNTKEDFIIEKINFGIDKNWIEMIKEEY